MGESREQLYERWKRGHDILFASVRTNDEATPNMVRLIGAMADTIGRLAFALDEDDPKIRHRVFDRAIKDLEDFINELEAA